MSLAPSQSILRVKEGNIYGWSGVKSLTSGALTLLNYANPSYFYLTRIQLGLDWSSIGVGETLSYTIQVDGQNLFTDKYVITDQNIGFQPQQLEFVIPPNSQVKIQATQSGNNGTIGCVLTGFRL